MTAAVLRRAAAASLVLAALLPANATASRTQQSIFQDDSQLVLAGSAARERGLDDIQRLGADTVHSVVFWNKVAPVPLSAKRPTFDGADPKAYPAAQWDAYDALVRGAHARGLDLLLSPSAPMPAWASGCRASKKVRKTCRPDLTQFKRFVQALGTRYSGEYVDEDEGNTVLPRVSQWSVWNEPNQGGWLQPQFERRGGRTVPVSPVLYRELVRAAIKGLQASGHGRDTILLGETAPLGRRTGPLATRPIPPGDFLRDVLCLDARGRALKGQAATDLECAGFRRLAVTGLSHHPYTRGGSRPPTTAVLPGEITISSVDRLKAIRRAAAQRGRIRGGLPIFYTEFGYQTDPPDAFGVSLAEQAVYSNESDWIAYKDPDVRSVAQYELRDEPALSAFQTGLRFVDGRPKPAYDAYRLPLWVTRRGGSAVVWGQVRASRGAVDDVEIQGSPDGGTFTTLETVQTTNVRGYLEVRVPVGSTRFWRLRWTPPGGGDPVLSRVAKIGG